MAESRKEREVVLSDYRKQADEKKEFAEKVERRVCLRILLCLLFWDFSYYKFPTVETCFYYSLYCSM